MKKISYLIKAIILLFIFSCQNENAGIDNNSNSKFKDLNLKFTEYQPLDTDNPDLLDLKNKVIEKHNRIMKNAKIKNNSNLFKVSLSSDNIDWSKSFKREEGKLKGLFVPFKNSNESEITMISSLLMDGKMRLYIVHAIKSNKENNYQVNFYTLSGVFVKQLNNKVSKQSTINDLKLRLKPSGEDDPCSTTNECINDYDSWFNSCSSCNRFGNNSSQVIRYISENGHYGELYPGEYTESGVDGFRIGNTIHKVTNGYNTFGVNGVGDYDYNYNVFTNWYYQSYGGDLSDIGEENNPYWNPLK